MTATVSEVSNALGLEQSLVQKVLDAGIDAVPEDQIQMILKTAKEMGYQRKPHRLGIVYEEESSRGLTHPFFSLILNEFKTEAESRGYDITFLHPVRNQNADGYVSQCRENQLDGVCLVCVDFSSPQVLALVESGIPCLTIDHMFKRVPAVLSDNENGIRRLLEYAIGKGHQRIALIHGHNNSIVTKTRIEQFSNVMTYYKLPVPPEYIKDGLYDDVPLTRKLVTELLKLENRPTCILLPDDIAYIGAKDAVLELGLRIPADISFMGYDGIPLVQSMSPQLTTIRQSTDLMGKTAAQRLISMIESPSKYDRLPTIYPVELIEGGTVLNLK